MTAATRVGLVGVGIAGRSHALDLVTDDRFDVVGVVAGSFQSAARFAEEFGVGVPCQDLTSLLAEAPDAVVVAVPHGDTLAIADEVVRTGTFCLVEKPIATSSATLATLAGIKMTTGLIGCFNRRYQSHVHAARDAIRSGALGILDTIDADWRAPYRSRFSSDAVTFRRKAGARHGVLVDAGTHALDAVAFLMDDVPQPLTCRLDLNERGAEVAADLAFICKNRGVHGRLVIGESAVQESTMTVVGSEGKFVLTGDGLMLETSGTTTFVPAGDLRRPVEDILAVSAGAPPLGTGVDELIELSEAIMAAYDEAAGSSVAKWRRPRAKALGRLNGAC